MATKLGGPWSAQYPIRFYSGGDTTAQGFGKHIQEIARIYGLLNALDTGKVDSDDVLNLIGAVKHNNLKEIQGGTATERYHLTAAQVEKLNNAASAADVIKNHNSLQGLQGGSSTERYHLTNAQVSGLQNLIDNPPGAFAGEALTGPGGYVKFSNGLMIEWGRWSIGVTDSDEVIKRHYFSIPFPNACFIVLTSLNVTLKQELSNTDYDGVDISVATLDWTKDSCRVIMQDFGGPKDDLSSAYAMYIALGR